MYKRTPLAAALLALYGGLSLAQDETVMPRVDVVGGENSLPNIAGAAQILGSDELEASHVFTVNEALRKVPGVHARDEEGFGLRPNIAMRGLNPTRSTKITLLEDGIPLAYAPYGDNASYYHPMVERYERIEVLKGSGALLFGPQTIGGVINYITPVPSAEFGGYVQGTVGNRDYFNGKVNLGGNGMLLDYSRKQGDGARDNMEHALDDLNLKYTTAIGGNQALTLRGNYYQEDSTITYTGLTQAEYDNLGARYNPFRNDKFEADRVGLSATHEYDFGGGALLLTNLYYSKFDRDWWRQASNSSDSQCGASFSADRLAGVAVDPGSCNSVQGRLREYTTWGVEPRLTVAHGMGEFQAGAKAHFEEQDRLQFNGATPTARSGTLAESNLRETTAYSAFVANRFDLGQFTLTPILRYENIDADRTNRMTGASGSSSISETMPGIGATWNPAANLTLFTSLHKGFAPPRVEDLIGGSGTVTEVDAEESSNFELGLRHQPTAWSSLQAAWFRNDYDNLIAVGSIAGGSTPLSLGKALFEGVELAARADHDSGLFGRLAWTWLPTADQEEPFRNVATQAAVSGSAAGLRQPYTPEQTLTAAAGYGAGALRGEIEAQYVGEQFSDFANIAAPTADGQKGQIDAYTVWNAALNYRIDNALSAFATVKNVADKTYIVDRTRGIQVGMPRLVQVGMKYGF
jgi:Fe(3+) dicitrate transport protein